MQRKFAMQASTDCGQYSQIQYWYEKNAMCTIQYFIFQLNVVNFDPITMTTAASCMKYDQLRNNAPQSTMRMSILLQQGVSKRSKQYTKCDQSVCVSAKQWWYFIKGAKTLQSKRHSSLNPIYHCTLMHDLWCDEHTVSYT